MVILKKTARNLIKSTDECSCAYSLPQWLYVMFVVKSFRLVMIVDGDRIQTLKRTGQNLSLIKKVLLSYIIICHQAIMNFFSLLVAGKLVESKDRNKEPTTDTTTVHTNSTQAQSASNSIQLSGTTS